MMFARQFSLWLAVCTLAAAQTASACDTCGCSINSRGSASNQSSGAMVTTPTASSLGRGHGSIGFLFEHQRYNKIPALDAHMLHHQGHDVHGKNHEEIYTTSLGYGVTDRLDLFLTAPIVSRSSIQIEDHDALGRDERASGFGDMQLLGKYRFWDDGAQAAAVLGMKMPTGETSDLNKSDEKFGPELQPGTGGWDLVTGLALSRAIGDRWSFATGWGYTYRGEGAQDWKAGDVFRYNAGVSYLLGAPGRWPNASVSLELHTEWALRDHSREEKHAQDSGGTTVLLSPGVSANVTPSLTLFASLPVPIYQNLGGQHEELVYEVLSGAAWRF